MLGDRRSGEGSLRYWRRQEGDARQFLGELRYNARILNNALKPTILALCVLVACAGSSVEGTDPVDSADSTRPLVGCPAERHEMCTRDYRPVCGRIGVSDEWKTYSNGCMACAEPKVSGFHPGFCPAEGE